jgi:hypothetical protein
MGKITLIGDCHSTRIYEHWDPSQNVDFKAWGKAGQKAWSFDPLEKYKKNRFSSKFETLPPYLGLINSEIEEDTKENLKISFSSIEDEGTILLWLGYVDIKVALPKYQNAEECVDRYIESSLNYFQNANLIFIEPFPQFIPYIGIKEEGHEEWSWQDRKKSNDDFIFHLNKKLSSYNIKNIISQEMIFKTLNFSQNEMLEDKAKIYPGIPPIDTFSELNMKKLYNMFIREALNK